MPLKGIGFARGLADEGLPVHVCADVGIAGAVPHPADNGVRVNSDGVVSMYIAECDGIAVGEYRNIRVLSFSGQRGCCDSFL